MDAGDRKTIIRMRARKHRKNPTPAERHLWPYLRRKAMGFNIRRQKAVCGGFIVDFYCPKARLCIELDGSSHIGREGYDQWRERIITKKGFTVLRFSNEEALLETGKVIEKIRLVIQALTIEKKR